MTEEELNSKHSSNSNMDLVTFIKIVWEKKTKILVSTGIFIVFGIFFALISEGKYVASSVFIPQISSSSNVGSTSGLGGLASLAGINLASSSSGGDFPPSLYPSILKNAHFKLALLEAPLTISESGQEVSYREYFENIYKPSVLSKIKKYTLGLPKVVLKALRGSSSDSTKEGGVEISDSGLIRLTANELSHFSRLGNQISIISNVKDGFVTISVEMPDPDLAAQLAKYVENQLEKSLIDYKIQNAKAGLKYIQDRYDEKKMNFEKKQGELADFADQNQNLNTARAQAQLQKVQSDYDLAFEIYLNLAKELEQAQLQVSKDTPVVSVIQPVVVPINKSGTSRTMVVIIFMVIGLMFYPIKLYLSIYLKSTFA